MFDDEIILSFVYFEISKRFGVREDFFEKMCTLREVALEVS